MSVPHCGETVDHRPHADCPGFIPKTQQRPFGPTNLEVLSWFDSVPLNDEQQEVVARLREVFKGVVIEVLEAVPASADRTTALRQLHAAATATVFAYSHNLPKET